MYIILGGWLDGQTVKQEAGFCLFLSEIKTFSSKSFICQCKLCNGMQHENGKLYRCSNSYSKRVEACNEQCLMSCLCTLSDHLSYESDGRRKEEMDFSVVCWLPYVYVCDVWTKKEPPQHDSPLENSSLR